MNAELGLTVYVLTKHLFFLCTDLPIIKYNCSIDYLCSADDVVQNKSQRYELLRELKKKRRTFVFAEKTDLKSTKKFLEKE